MGANDNLSGISVCYQLTKCLSKPENRSNNIEIWINGYLGYMDNTKLLNTLTWIIFHLTLFEDLNIKLYLL